MPPFLCHPWYEAVLERRAKRLADSSESARSPTYAYAAAEVRPYASPLVLAVCAAAALALVATGCNDHREHGPIAGASAPSAVPIARLERALDVDPGVLEPERDPAAPPGDLRAEMAGFTTVDACVLKPGHFDALAGDALEAIGYDTFLRDACRIVGAAKARDARLCDAIDASPLKEHCQVTVAEIAGDPDGCPWRVASRPARGRDPACVAIASRDLRLCAGADVGAATCEAVLAHDARRCARVASHAEQARCTRAVTRYAGVVPAATGDAAPVAAPTATLELEEGDGGVRADLTQEVAHGLVLTRERQGLRIVFGPLSEMGTGFVALSPYEHPTLALELVVNTDAREVHGGPAPRQPSGGSTGVAHVERVEVLVPGRAQMRIDPSTLVATVNRLELERGGHIELAVRSGFADAGPGPASPAGPMLRADVSTFVRDVVDMSDRLAPGPARLNTDSRMR